MADAGAGRPSYSLVRGSAAPSLQLAAEASFLLAVLHSAQLVAKPLAEAAITQQLQVCSAWEAPALRAPALRAAPCALHPWLPRHCVHLWSWCEPGQGGNDGAVQAACRSVGPAAGGLKPPCVQVAADCGSSQASLALMHRHARGEHAPRSCETALR